jgi:hypothetical protein
VQTDGTDADLLQASSSTASGTAPASAEVLRFLLMVHDGRKYGAPDSALVAAGGPAAPLASAGPDRTGPVGAVLTLSSAASAPAPGQTILSRQWTQLSGTDWFDVDARDPGFDPAAASPLVAVPSTVSSLSPNRTLLFGLTVTDATGTSRQDLVAVNFQNLLKNAAPQVSASTTAAIFRPGATVALSSSASDPDGDPLTYSWTQVSGPAAAISGTALANASVTAPIASGTLVYRVTVSDNTSEPNGIVSVDVPFSVNRPPAVSAVTTPASGPDGTFVTLNGSATTDPDDAALTYAWTETPPLSGAPNVALSGAATATATFTMPAYVGSVGARRRTFRLTVTDAMGPAFAVAQTVNFAPNKGPAAPTVTTSGDYKVFYSDSAAASDKSEVLSVSATTDADGDPITFTWTVESGPITTVSVLLSATSGSAVTFRSAPKPTASQLNTGGIYVIGVTATDGVEQSTKTTKPLLVTSSLSGDVYPLFTTNCVSCHPGSGGFSLAGGASTARSLLISTNRVVPKNSGSSTLFQRMNSASSPMPQGGKLPQQLVNMVRDWIEPEWNVASPPGLSAGAEDN